MTEDPNKTFSETGSRLRLEHSVNLIEKVLVWVLPFASVGVFFNVMRATEQGGWQTSLVQIALFAAALSVLILRRHLSPTCRLLGYCAIALAYGLAGLVRWGLAGQGLTVILLALILSSLAGIWHWAAFLVIGIICCVLVAAGHVLGYFPLLFDPVALLSSPTAWILAIMAFIFAGISALLWDQLVKELMASGEKLLESETRYKTFFNSAGDAILILQEETIMDCNPSAAALFSPESKDEILALSLYELSPASQPDGASSREKGGEMIEDALKGEIQRFAWVHKKMDGSLFNADVTLAPILLEGRVHLQAIIKDVTERVQANEEMRKLKNLLANIINSMPSILVGVDREGRINQWNREAENTTGKREEEVQGRLIAEIFPVFFHKMDKVIQAIAQREVVRETQVPWNGGKDDRLMDMTIYPLTANGVEGAVIRVDDITDRVRIERMLIQTEKMHTLGGLAAGMAHEINNPLAGMIQNAQVILNRVKGPLAQNVETAVECGLTMEAINCYMENRGITEMLESIMSSGVRAAEIVENMLNFSRKSEAAFLPADLADLLDKALGLAASAYDPRKRYDFKSIEIIKEYDLSMGRIPCEAAQIQQVLLNLFQNAAHAMAWADSPPDTPRITVRTFREGGYAAIEVSDNGPGMPEHVRRRVFEPFFTTKEVGVGTGLGLSVSYFIVTENHGGTMSVASAPGMGAAFTLRLPLAGARQEA